VTGWDGENTLGRIGRGCVLDKVVKGLKDAGVGVGGDDERVALLLEDDRCAVDGWVDERDDFKARAKLTGRMKSHE
jgi:hypothetical protein